MNERTSQWRGWGRRHSVRAAIPDAEGADDTAQSDDRHIVYDSSPKALASALSFAELLEPVRAARSAARSPSAVTGQQIAMTTQHCRCGSGLIPAIGVGDCLLAAPCPESRWRVHMEDRATAASRQDAAADSVMSPPIPVTSQLTLAI